MGFTSYLVNGFKGLVEQFIHDHPNYFIAPLRINGSAIESVFSCLKYICDGNLSSTNYSTSLSAITTQWDIVPFINQNSEKDYRTDMRNIN